MFDLNISFSHLLGPTSLYALILPRVNKGIIIITIIHYHYYYYYHSLSLLLLLSFIIIIIITIIIIISVTGNPERTRQAHLARIASQNMGLTSTCPLAEAAV